MKYVITLLVLLLAQNALFAQKPERVVIDSTHYYLRLVPKSKPVGILIILHGGSEDAAGVMNQITLDEIALKHHFIVAFPNIEDDDFKMTIARRIIDTVAHQLVDKYGVPKNNIFLGGLSGGGMQTINYAERAIRVVIACYSKHCRLTTCSSFLWQPASIKTFGLTHNTRQQLA